MRKVMAPGKLQVTILASEWGSSKGGLSTINRELAIQLAKFPCDDVTLFLPKCSDKDKEAAASFGISILTAVKQPGVYDELDWLSFPPDHLRIDVVVGHGVKLGRQAQVIRDSHKCKWVQVVHTDPEELGMFKCYENPISTGEQKHHVEVELCKMADFVVGVGPKLVEAFRKYLGFCRKHQEIFEFTPGIFADFCSVQQVTDERNKCNVLVFGRGGWEDFKLKGFDIAATSVAALSDTCLVFVGARHRKHDEIAKRFVDFGIPEKRLRVRGYMDNPEALKQLFCQVDLVLMPSRTEGFGLTSLQALSSGLPVIVSKNSGFGEALCNVPCGSLFVIDSEEPSKWTAAIKDIWNKDRKKRLGEAEALRASYAERYSWSEQCKGLIEKMFELRDGTSSEPQITPQALGARELKWNMDFTEISCDHVITALKVEARKLKQNQDFTGHSPRVPPERGKGIEKHESEQLAALTSCPSNVKEWIRQLYHKCQGVILPVPWCEEFNYEIEDLFTRLRIVAKETTRGVATTREVSSMTSIFTPHKGCKQPLIVLIEGESGMGKTTYCQKLVYDWANKQSREWDESFPRIDLLLLLSCRGIKCTLWGAIEEQILPEGIEPKEKEMFFQFLKDNPSKVLFLLDGLDDADPQNLEMVFRLIQRKQLPGCYIVLLSRHEAGSKVKPYADTLLEIVGFTATDASCYIRKYFQHAEHLAEKLISKVNCENGLRELTQNPLNTFLLCAIFKDLDEILPNNISQLYTEVVHFILRRYESKNALSNKGEDRLLVYKKELMILGRIALDSLRKGELYFEGHKGDIKESSLIKFGFLSIQVGRSKRAPCDRYGFSHKIFQEFFSGYFLAFSVIDGVTNFHSVLTDIRYMGELRQVLKFMFGIVAQRSEETAVSVVHIIASIVNERGRTSGKYDSYLWLAHYLINEYKTCSADLYLKLAHKFGESLELVDMVVRHVFFCRENEYISTFFQALSVNSTVTKLKVLEWAFGTEATNLLSRVLRENTSLSSLDLFSNFIDDEGANSLAEALKVNTSLSSLGWRTNSIGAGGANSLAQALKVNRSISHLDFSSNSIGDEGANSLSEALKENTSLSSLNLSSNFIGAEGANSLAQALRVNPSLSSLDLFRNSIGDEGANSLAQVLKVNSSISHLNLSDNSICAEGANSLSEALKADSSLSSLNLSSNFIGAEGANSLAQALRGNPSLSSLDLFRNSIGDEGASSLAEALKVNSSISHLNLSSNCIGAEGAILLAQALRVNRSISSLDLFANSINTEGANSLAQALKVNTSLSSLNLSFNFIGDEGANSLAQALRVNSSLSSLDLSLNVIGAEGKISLSEALRLKYRLSVSY